MAEGSSSAAPVIRPRPKARRARRPRPGPGCCGLCSAAFDESTGLRSPGDSAGTRSATWLVGGEGGAVASGCCGCACSAAASPKPKRGSSSVGPSLIQRRYAIPVERQIRDSPDWDPRLKEASARCDVLRSRLLVCTERVTLQLEVATAHTLVGRGRGSSGLSGFFVLRKFFVSAHPLPRFSHKCSL